MKTDEDIREDVIRELQCRSPRRSRGLSMRASGS